MANLGYKFQHKGQNYLVKVQPDITCRGGADGKGTTTSIWRLQADNQAIIPGVRGYQGRHSKAGVLRVISAWDKETA